MILFIFSQTVQFVYRFFSFIFFALPLMSFLYTVCLELDGYFKVTNFIKEGGTFMAVVTK